MSRSATDRIFPSEADALTRPQAGRRLFCLHLTQTCAALALWPAYARVWAAGGRSNPPNTVTVVTFGPDGKQTGKAVLPRVTRTDEEWKQLLSPISFEVARHAATERAFTGDTWNEHGRGLFRCVCCDLALFSSETKFESGTGWPSFWKPIARENVLETSDRSLGVPRTAVSCRLCEAHLGHVFDDGPRPTGLRYCMNSASLKFVQLA